MISNLQFYGITAILGLLVSLASWREDGVQRWKVWALLLVPVGWIALGIAFMTMLGDGAPGSIGDIIKYFDASNLYTGEFFRRSVRVVGAVGLVAASYWWLVFDVAWRIKNRIVRNFE